MKIKIPEIEISEKMGFDPDLDIFKRKSFGERLANLVENATDSPVIAIDSAWGEGKSTFIKMWRGYIEHQREKKLKSIYFDAFENDHQKDAFLAVTSEIYAKISGENVERKKEFLRIASKTAKSLTRGSIKLGVQLATSGIISGSMIDKAEDGISNLLSDQVDEIVGEKLKNIKSDKKAISDFKKELEKFSEDEGNGAPIIFIIDELDRCRPDFALDLLEQTKHLFSANGIIFILITNREQLEESIRFRYGPNINAKNYLHKFVNIWLSLPRTRSDDNKDDGENFINYAVNMMTEENEKIAYPTTIAALTEIIKINQPSYREIERILAYYAIINNMSDERGLDEDYQLLSAIACYIKACKHETIKDTSKIETGDIITSIGIDKITKKQKSSTLEYMISLVKFDLASEHEKSAMVQRGDFHQLYFNNNPGSTLIRILSWLQKIER
ncbi:P-loop NTPase fold protein [Thalassospira sp. TSL5-1]|uniref:KAP family P-loop NTPase fold protein n=1 Tax=Thalassospira sp. TSL5-1 TaxID=1544451 RepID=UPI00093DA546|nr:P-loop NTPase fold protein [Thalassospira sp. TSL5-1]